MTRRITQAVQALDSRYFVVLQVDRAYAEAE